MTSKQIRGFKKRFGRHMDRIAKVVSRFKKLPAMKKRKVTKDLMKDLKKEARVIERLEKRYVRMAKAA